MFAQALQNRRNAPRFPVNDKIIATLGDIRGEVVDVSQDGMGINLVCPVPLPVFMQLPDLELELDQGVFMITGVPVQSIHYHGMEDELISGEKTYRYGVKLGDIKPRHRFQLECIYRLARNRSHNPSPEITKNCFQDFSFG